MGTAADGPPGRARRRDALGPLLGAPLLGVVGPLALWPALVAHVVLPLTIARHLTGEGRHRYAEEDAPRVAEGIAWLAGLYAWAGLVTTRPPWRDAATGAVAVAGAAPPRAGAALLRLVTGLPALVAQLALALAALLPWLALAAAVAATGRRPAVLWRLQERVLARHVRLLRRQASLA